ncbi:hypothetical protein MK786_14935 [Microbacterium sp. CFH 31415]|uniref:hypothetical protein n=1 Tax=Microbacterium sp. CFH 31415 TaxID=2921732 RepID=UPI001F129CF2|nr:hypothetical protein [Microbacterium sp. CFH 31415]MCH6232044.1 hypothetical protein [Microbacterium sp. CFH 31415]
MTSPHSPFAYAIGDEADAARERSIGPRWMPMSIGLVASAVFIIVTIVNVLASGIPNPVDGTSAWDSDVPFPLIPLPSWLTVPVALAPLLTAVLLWRVVDARHKALLTNTIVYALTVFLLLPILLSWVYPEPGGIPDGDRTMGWHWLGAPLALIGAIVLIIRRVTLPASPVPAVERDAFFLEEVELRRKARYDKKARATLEADLADLRARQAAATAATPKASEPHSRAADDQPGGAA